MRRIRVQVLFWTLIWLVCATGCYAQKATMEVTTPAQNLESATWDFGRVKEGQVLTHEFSLTNQTRTTLRIKDVSTSCGCTVSEVKSKVLKPQGTTVITVKFNSTGYAGSTTQFVYVSTDNLDNPILRYIIKAYVAR